MADRIVSHVRTDELDGNLARLIGDTHALLGNFSRAEVLWTRCGRAVLRCAVQCCGTCAVLWCCALCIWDVFCAACVAM
jgi:hypothetical protein